MTEIYRKTQEESDQIDNEIITHTELLAQSGCLGVAILGIYHLLKEQIQRAVTFMKIG